MWLLTRMAIIFYVCVLWVTSLAVILFVLHQLEIDTITHLLKIVYNDHNMRIIVGCIAVGFILVSIVLENLIYGKRRMERNIVFENPSGPVSVSLVAIEDLIKRLIVQVPEVKEIRPYVIAVKKGLDIDVKLTLRHEANIPELTARFQELVRQRVEEALGLDGKINVGVHVTKISLDDIKGRNKADISIAPQVPFHGYRT